MVLTHDIEKTKEFYCDGLGMEAGFRPKMGFPGYWLYLGDVPVVHVADLPAYIDRTTEVEIPISSGPPGTGAVDHIAFNCEDYDGVKNRLENKGFKISTAELNDGQLKQIYLIDPNGLIIELNFHA